MTDDSIAKRLLRTFVPINALTEDHLAVMLRDRVVEEHACTGQRLFELGDSDGQYVFLLSGRVRLEDSTGKCQWLQAGDPAAAFPLADEQPRALRAVVEQDVSLVRLERNWLDNLVCWDQTAQYIMLDIATRRELDEDVAWMSTLLRSNLFYKVPPNNIREVLGRFEPVLMDAGQVVLRQGELGDCCYVIKEGEVEVSRSEDGRSRPVPIATLGPGRCFGEDALVYSASRNATVTMLTDGVLMKLDKQAFYLLLREPNVQTLPLEGCLQQEKEGAVWLDVRSQEEFERGHLQDALHMPLRLLPLKQRLLKPGRTYLAYCDNGLRSAVVSHVLAREGLTVLPLRGGVRGLPADTRHTFGWDRPGV